MENAAKALIVAGGVLIALLILTVGIVLFNRSSQLGQTYETKLTESEVKSFNANFIKFENREDITVQEIVSLAKFAIDYKEKTDIEVKIICGTQILSNKNNEELAGFVGENITKKYECTETTYEGPFETADYIKFTEIAGDT